MCLHIGNYRDLCIYVYIMFISLACVECVCVCVCPPARIMELAPGCPLTPVPCSLVVMKPITLMGELSRDHAQIGWSRAGRWRLKV